MKAWPEGPRGAQAGIKLKQDKFKIIHGASKRNGKIELLGFMRRLLNRFQERIRTGVFRWIANQTVAHAYNGLSP